ncbi:MAG: aminoglycoside phosphotransferase family protein [Chloroflexi bacterium]|nr:aminoglycoside phosphotransferase family protein [Chloroflexota bacterium]
MHPDQLAIDDRLVTRLIAEQFPAWAHLPLRRFDSACTVNAIYRLGEDLQVRLPLRPDTDATFDKEARWLPWLAPQLAQRLPLAIPEQIAVGLPTEEYPSRWAIYRWLPGEPAATETLDARHAAADLATFILALKSLDPAGGPEVGLGTYRRGGPLALRDESARRAIEALRDDIDTDAATAAWDAALAVPEWQGPPTWFHGDLMPGNLLMRGGRLTAVIDFGACGVGDPACDLIPAWLVLPPDVRTHFRALVGADAASWERGKGCALSIGLVGLPYYRESNPRFAAVARQAIEAVLADAHP